VIDDQAAALHVPAQAGRLAGPQRPQTPTDPAPNVRRFVGFDRPAVVAAVLGVAGVAFRLVLLLAQAPPSNSDEATMGLAAIHIAKGHDFPVFYYGQNYMGTIEAWLAAPIIAVFGPSVLALRIPLLLMYAAFVFLAYHLARRLYTPWLAVATVAVLALASFRVAKNQLFAGGGYPEISPLAVLLFLLALARPTRRTAAAFGFILGLLVWDDWIILPYAAAAAVVFYAGLRAGWPEPEYTASSRRGLLRTAVIATVVGALPQVANLLHPIGHYGPAGGVGIHLYDGVIFGVPFGTGMCGPDSCAPWQMWWGIAYPLLLVIAAVVAVRAVRELGRNAAGAKWGIRSLGTADPDELVARLARLGLVVAAALTLVAYVRSNRAGDDPVNSSRYVSTLLISTPAILSVLTLRSPGRFARPARWFGGAVLAAMLATMLVATVELTAAIPGYARSAAGTSELIATLEEHHIDRVYGEYWTCYLITFASAEQVICANVNDDLSPALDRYPAYRQMVDQAGDARYVAPVGSPLDAYLSAHRSAELSAGGYNVYQ
jgi:hypothetical protein